MQKIDQMVIFDKRKRKSIEVEFDKIQNYYVVKLLKIYDKETIRKKLGWKEKDFVDVTKDPYRIQQILNFYSADIHRTLEKLVKKTLKRVDKGDRGIIAYEPVEQKQVEELKQILGIAVNHIITEQEKFGEILERRVLKRIIKERNHV